MMPRSVPVSWSDRLIGEFSAYFKGSAAVSLRVSPFQEAFIHPSFLNKGGSIESCITHKSMKVLHFREIKDSDWLTFYALSIMHYAKICALALMLLNDSNNTGMHMPVRYKHIGMHNCSTFTTFLSQQDTCM